MLSEDSIGSLMREDVEASERPSARIDVGRAMVAGRRSRARRRALGVGGSGLAVLVAAALVIAGLAPAPRPDPAVPRPSLPAAPATIDPLVRYLRFGWLPDGLTTRNYYGGQYGTGGAAGLAATAPIKDYFDPSAGVLAMIYPTGVTPQPPVRAELQRQGGPPPVPGTDPTSPPPVPTAVSTPAPAVHGAAARWMAYSIDGKSIGEQLQWEYGSGAYATVRVNLPDTDNRAAAIRVAAGLSISDHEPLSLPVTLSDLPTPLRPVRVAIWENVDQPGSAQAELDLGTVVGSTTSDVNVRLYLQKGRTPHPDTTVDGHPVTDSAGCEPNVADVSGSLTVWELSGHYLAIQKEPAATAALGAQGCLGLYQRLRVNPDWQPGL